MPLELHPMTESDFPSLVRIQNTAFNTGITYLLSPQPPTSESIQSSISKHLKAFHNEPDIHYLKVVDTELDDDSGSEKKGKMIAAAKWRVNEKERTEEQIQSMLPVPGKEEEGEDKRGLRDFMNYLHRVRKRYMGTKPFYFLQMLITDPDHQRRGAGAMLIDWGLEKADKAGLPAFLEASVAGRPLYERKGFEVQAVEVFDMTKYGHEGTDENAAMIRPAKV